MHSPLRRVSGLLAVLILLAASANAQLPVNSTFFGGKDLDRIQGAARDSAGRLYVTGHTRSTNYKASLGGAVGGYDKTQNGDSDGFVARLSADLSKVEAWTYLGGSDGDRCYSVLVDPFGDVVVVGFTASQNFPRTTGPGHAGAYDVFVARLSPDLKALKMSRLIGGSQAENARGSFTVDSQGNVFVSGRTSSKNFPVAGNPVQPNHADAGGTWDAFVLKMTRQGSLVWSTFLGGVGNDVAYSGIDVDANGVVTIAGMTRSADFPTTPGAYQETYGGHGSDQLAWGDGFVARLAPNGNQLIWSTYVGGSHDDTFSGNDGLEVDAHGQVLVVGQTRSADFPTTATAYEQGRQGQTETAFDGVVVRLSEDGKDLRASTLLAGRGSEELSAVAVDPWGNVYVSGNTTSNDFPTTVDAFDRTYAGGGSDIVLVKLDPKLRRVHFSTFLGGGGQAGYGDRGRTGLLTDQLEYVLVGDTDSLAFPTGSSAAQQSFQGGSADGFVFQIDLVSLRSFGQAKTNSLGKQPTLAWNGRATASSGGFQLIVQQLPPSASGVLFFGQDSAEIPFQGGTLYARPPLRRSVQVQADASGRALIDVLVHPGLVGGSATYQFWYVDPAHPDGTGAGLSGALKVSFLP